MHMIKELIGVVMDGQLILALFPTNLKLWKNYKKAMIIKNAPGINGGYCNQCKIWCKLLW